MNEIKDVVVIGGGLAGLAAAAYLGRAGKSVAVVEKAHALGGRAATQENGGYSLNLGAHALYRGGAAFEVLRELGVQFSGAVPEPQGGLAFDRGELHTLPTGALSLLTTGLFNLGAKLEMGRLLSTLPSLDPAPFTKMTASAWLDHAVRSPEVRRFVAALLRLTSYCGDLDQLSAGVALAQLQIATQKGVLYLDGGWKTLVSGLRDAAVGSGAQILTGARVQRVALRDGEVAGVKLANGERLAARSVLIAAGPRAAAALVPDSPALAGYAARATPVRVACLDVALSSLPRPRTRYVLGLDRPLYLAVHSAFARLAPPGGAVIQLVHYLPEAAGQDPERELDALLERVQPGYRDVCVERRFLPSLVVSNAPVTAQGGGYAARAPVAVPGPAGLFLAGDWVGSTGMLADASLGSAREAASAILARRALDQAA